MPRFLLLLVLGILLSAAGPPTAHAAELRVSKGTVVVEDGDEYLRGNSNHDGGSGDEHIGGDGGAGPLLVDIFETRAHQTDTPDTRMASSAGYYRGAVMGMRAARTAPNGS